jgi:hypothetical protein
MENSLKLPKIGQFCQIEENVENGDDVILSDFVREQ